MGNSLNYEKGECCNKSVSADLKGHQAGSRLWETHKDAGSLPNRNQEE